MARKLRSAASNLVSLGTFGESEARAIAAALTTREEIPAEVENLYVVSGPTVWWHVHVPAARMAAASMWLSGYHAGRDSMAR